MCAALLSVCRVCLASDREMYRLANTALEDTYERVTSGTLVVEGRPCCVCGACLSALRRCRRFIDTAREANDALDRWIRNQPNTDTLKLANCPLFSFTQSPIELIDTTCNEDIMESGAKETYTAENIYSKLVSLENQSTSDDEGNIITGEIKYKVTNGDGDYTHSAVLDDDGGKTPPSTSKRNNGTENDAPLETRRPITPEHQRGNTDLAVSLHNEGTTFSCHLCNYKTIYKYCYRNHFRKHSGEKPFACDKCNFKSANKGSLNKHLKMHTGEKPFTCDKCGYKFVFKAHLSKHLMIHTGEKPYVCDKCGYRCINNSQLRTHFLIHTGEKLLACDNCDFKCNSRGNLIQHIRIHTGEKPFACDRCNFRCNQRQSLKRHLKTHAVKKPLACDNCDFKCNYKQALNKHIKGVHAGLMPGRPRRHR